MRVVQKAWKTRDAILDWLTLDGGWLTAEGLALDIRRNDEAVIRILRRLRHDQLVESRIVELARREARLEWRAL